MSDVLAKIIMQIFSPSGLNITSTPFIYQEKKLMEYGATRFSLNDYKIEFRIGKKTDDRPGNFLTAWYRSAADNKISPFHINDVDFLIIYVYERINEEDYQGIYVFGKNILAQHNILSTNDSDGKLSFRVFPPWSEYSANESIKKMKDTTRVKPMQYFTHSARKTQLWQNRFFLHISRDYILNDTNSFLDLLKQ